MLKFQGVQVWERVEAILPERIATVDALHSNLRKGEEQHGQLMRSILQTLVTTLNEIAHVSEGETERVVEAEALQVNRGALTDQNSFAALVSKLRVAEVQLEKGKREEFDRGVAAWRVLRTQHAIRGFVERLRSDEFAQPPKRRGVFEELRGAQAKHFGTLSEQMLLLAGAAPCTLDAKMSRRCELALNLRVESRAGRHSELRLPKVAKLDVQLCMQGASSSDSHVRRVGGAVRRV